MLDHFTYWPNYAVAAFLLLGIITSIAAKKLTIAAALTAGIMGWLVFYTTGFTGLLLLCTFFVLGNLATSWKRDQKRSIYCNDSPGGRRDTFQVLANGGVALIAAISICGYPECAAVLKLMMAASLGSATADTLSSELGVIYGRRFYNCISFKADVKGLDGVISLEGTLIGAAGAAIIAIVYVLGFGWNPGNLLILILAGVAGNYADSVFGVSLERRGYLDNDQVNFSSTLFAALLACGLSMV